MSPTFVLLQLIAVTSVRATSSASSCCWRPTLCSTSARRETVPLSFLGFTSSQTTSRPKTWLDQPCSRMSTPMIW